MLSLARSGYGKLLTGGVGAAVLAFASTIILLNGLGQTSFGYFVYAQTIGLIGAALANAQTWQVLVYNLPRHAGYEIPLFRFALRIDVAAAVLTSGGALLLVTAWPTILAVPAQHEMLFIIFALNPLVAANGSAQGLLRHADQIGPLSQYRLLGALIKLGIATASLSVEMKLTHLAVAWLAADLCATIFLFVFASRILRTKRSVPRAKLPCEAATLYRSVGWAWLTSLSDIPIQHADRLLIGRFISIDSLASYAIARRLASALMLLVEPVYQLLLSDFAKAATRNDFAALRRSALQVARNAGLAMLIGALGLLAFVYLYDDAVFGSVVKANSKVLLLLLAGNVAAATLIFVHPLVWSLGYHKQAFYATAGSNIAYLLATAWAAVAGDLMLVAAATALQPLLIGLIKVAMVFPLKAHHDS